MSMKIKVTPSVLEEWRLSERASWEDHGSPEEGHAYNILSRHKSIIDIRSTKEAALLIKSADFQGDVSGLDPELVRTRQAIGRIGGKLSAVYGFYYSYPGFRSTKTGEVIPDPTKEEEAKLIEPPVKWPPTMSLTEAESRFSLKQIQEMARSFGLSPTGDKRHLIRQLLRIGGLP